MLFWGQILLSLVFSGNIFGSTWMRVISLQWNESALSISPLSIAVMLSISYSHSLSATLTFHNVSVSMSFHLFYHFLFLSFFVSLFSLSCLHLLRGRAGRQLAIRRPLFFASFALTREKEVLLKMEIFISRKPDLFLTLRNCFLAKTPSSLKTAQ